MQHCRIDIDSTSATLRETISSDNTSFAITACNMSSNAARHVRPLYQTKLNLFALLSEVKISHKHIFMIFLRLTDTKVAFHMFGMAGPSNYFLNGTHEFSELVWVRMALLVDQSLSCLPLRSAEARELGELWWEKCTRAP